MFLFIETKYFLQVAIKIYREQQEFRNKILNPGSLEEAKNERQLNSSQERLKQAVARSRANRIAEANRGKSDG